MCLARALGRHFFAFESSRTVALSAAERNARRANINWQFSLDKAREKLARYYQKV